MNRLSDVVLAVSKHSADTFVEHGGRSELVRLLYNFVTPPQAASEGELDELRRRIGLPPGSTAIGCVGYVNAAKGQAVLLDAFRRISPERPRLYLVFVGEALPQERRQLLAGLDDATRERIIFTGPMTDVAQAMGILTIHVTPSQWEEPFGRVALEAMLCRVVSVVSDRGGLPEIVGPVDPALIFPARQPEALAALLCELLDDPERRAHIVERAYREALERFSPRTQASKLIDIYNDVCRDRLVLPA